MSLALPEPRPSPTLRERVLEALRHTAPGGEPEFPYAASVSPEQVASLRGLLPEPLARAAVLVPLVERPDGLNVLFTLRASHLKNHAGQVSFPGGRMEPADTGPWEAALREAHEEIGLEPRHVELAGYLRDHIVITGYRVTPVVGFVDPGFALRLDTTEVEDVFEVPLPYVLDPANHLAQQRVYGGVSFTTWDIRYGDRQIWGATASMLLTLARLLRTGAP